MRLLALLLLTLPAVVQAQFNYIINNGTVTITGYTGPGGAVTIPDTINGLPVTSIGDSAFLNVRSLTSVTIPSTVTNIGNGAFYNCSRLAGLTIPSGVTRVEDYAFYSCTSLTSVTIPSSVTYIGDYAFYGCASLASVMIGSSVTNIGNGAFYKCTRLTGVTIPSSVTSIGRETFSGCASLAVITADTGNSTYGSVDGVLFDKSRTTLIKYPEGKTGDYAIPSSVTSIGDFAFNYCTGLTNVTIPSSVTNIGFAAFLGSTSLTNVTIPSGVASIGHNAFRNCTSLTSITIGASVTSIGDGAFASCDRLTNITIPDSVTSIGSLGFYGCSNLTSVTIPSSVTSIGELAFSLCASLAEITVRADNSVYSSVDGVLFDKSRTMLIKYPESKTGNYTIPSSVRSIGISAFSFCTSLTSVTIPNSVTSIGPGAFFGCTSLTNVSVDTSNPLYSSLGGVLFDKAQATLVSFPAGLGGSYIIPNNVTNIGASAFGGCISLNGVYFQGNAPSVGSDSFTFIFQGNNTATVYFLPGTTGWGPFFGDRPTALWELPHPLILNNSSSFGIQTNQFGFTISWATNLFVVVEACTDLAQPIWSPVGTNTLIDGSSYFSDPQWTNHPARFYRLRSK